jgi:hypothetical protein
LREEFSDVELSTIRYYEERGLVLPRRTSKGYRVYFPEHIECLRVSLRMAQSGTPLASIQQHLIDRGLIEGAVVAAPKAAAAREGLSAIVTAYVNPTPASTPAASPSEPTLRVVPASAVSPGDAVALDTVMADENINRATIDQMREFSMLSTFTVGSMEMLSAADAEVVRSVAPLVRRGLDVRFLAGLRRTVDREIDLIRQAIEPALAAARGSDRARAMTEAQRVAEDMDALRQALVSRELDRFFAGS